MQSTARIRRGELTQDLITTHECRVGCIRIDGACGISSRALAHSLVTARKAWPFEGPSDFDRTKRVSIAPSSESAVRRTVAELRWSPPLVGSRSSP